MKKSSLAAYIAFFAILALPYLRKADAAAPAPLPSPETIAAAQKAAPPVDAPAGTDETAPEESAAPSSQSADKAEASPDAALLPVDGTDAPVQLEVLVNGSAVMMDMQDYLTGVVAAEMPASFHPEALKAQAVAARSYALYCMGGGKHAGQICTDYHCCQAWSSDAALRENWGESYDANLAKIRAAVDATRGQYLSYEGEAVFAAFHSSSAGATEDCGQVWNPLPYLLSVSSPETADSVPGYISTVECEAIDFRDTVLSAYPEADFTGSMSRWVGETRLDASGRVESVVLGGVELRGTQVRSLFALRSAAFTLSYSGGCFIFTVTGFGHGVGMSQYGANAMAEGGEGYERILSHYYPGTQLTY